MARAQERPPPRVLDDLDDEGFSLHDFRGATREQMVTALLDAICDAADNGGWTEDDDSGYGPNGYFERAMAKND